MKEEAYYLGMNGHIGFMFLQPYHSLNEIAITLSTKKQFGVPVTKGGRVIYFMYNASGGNEPVCKVQFL